MEQTNHHNSRHTSVCMCALYICKGLRLRGCRLCTSGEQKEKKMMVQGTYRNAVRMLGLDASMQYNRLSGLWPRRHILQSGGHLLCAHTLCTQDCAAL